VNHIYSSSWWQPKPGPFVTDGRLAHVYAGLAVACGSGLFGYAVLGWILTLGLPVALGWELLFPALHHINPKWGSHHPFGDVIDFICFVVGWIVGAVLSLVSFSIGGVA
jgi:hypothetical protein